MIAADLHFARPNPGEGFGSLDRAKNPSTSGDSITPTKRATQKATPLSEPRKTGRVCVRNGTPPLASLVARRLASAGKGVDVRP